MRPPRRSSKRLRQKGLLERTLVVITGEFGRTPTINANEGRDHWPRTMWTLAAGGGVKPGQLIGGTDAKGHGPDDATNLKPDDLGRLDLPRAGRRSSHWNITPRPAAR